MAKYEKDRFEDAAKAYFKEYGLVPLPNEAEERAAETKANANALAEKLGEKHAAYTGLRSVGKLRDSIARRFIRLSVEPLAPRPKKTSEKPATAEAKAPRQRKAPATPAPEAEAPAAAAS